MNNLNLKSQIQNDMKTAMKAKDTIRLGTIRLLMAAIKQREIDERIVLDDAAIVAVINKMIKQRRDSQSQFENAKRDDLAQKEAAEITLLQTYLPKQLSNTEIEQAVQAAITASGATSAKEMGKVMGILKNKLSGQADLGLVSKLVKERLA